ncbi:MAG: M50 family metallopeptidase [Clostridia bacterium]|nr:M50 family metallopeptidase [Clostridia bacterium]
MRYIYFGKKFRIGVEVPPLLYLLVCCGGVFSLYAAAAVLLHELGHAAAAALCGRRVEMLTVSLPGADIRCGGVCGYRSDLILFLAGPAASLLFAAAFFRPLPYFSFFSAVYGALNLIPVPCFDGGRALFAAVADKTDADRAASVCGVCGAVSLALLYPVAVFTLFYTSCNASLLILCCCVFADSYIRMR